MRLFGLFPPADCFVSLSADDVWLVLDHETAHGAAVDAAQVASHGARSTDHRVGYAGADYSTV